MKRFLSGTLMAVIAIAAVAGPLEDGDQALKEKRYGDAYRLLLPEANKGSIFAQYNIGIILSAGVEVEKDLHEASKWYEKAAMQGDADAEAALGLLYQYGKGVEKDLKKSYTLIEKAANKGNTKAQAALGYLYQEGIGIEKDLKKACELFEKAAKKGNVTAQNNLGTSYLRGDGVKQDNLKAFKWFTKAAENGNPAAQYSLGVMYQNGTGIPKDAEQGYKWFDMAASQGYGPAQEAVFKITLGHASAGTVSAMHNVGIYYLKGFGVTSNSQEGEKWLIESANGGTKESQKLLSQLYEKGGLGVEQDEKQSLIWKRTYEN